MTELDVCEELLRHLDGGELEVGDAPVEAQVWLQDLGLDVEVRQLLLWSWPQKTNWVGVLTLYSSRAIVDAADAERLARHRLLLAGCATNGDRLVLDLTTKELRPSFVSHDVFWEDDGVDPRACMEPIARSLASLLWRISEGRYVPRDFYAAEAFREFLTREGDAPREPESPQDRAE